jgi:hypothetical protein
MPGCPLLLLLYLQDLDRTLRNPPNRICGIFDCPLHGKLYRKICSPQCDRMSGEHFLLSSRKLFSLPGYDGKWPVTMAVQEMLVTMAVQELGRGLKTSRKNFPKRNFCSDLQFLFRPTARSADTASRRSDAVVP